MKKFEYIMWYVEEFKGDNPPILLYEVDLENERYATRMAEIFDDGRICQVIYEGWEFITEAPIPTAIEIISEGGYFAKEISKDFFEELYNRTAYPGEISELLNSCKLLMAQEQEINDR